MRTIADTRSGILIGVAFPTIYRAQEFEVAMRGLGARGLVAVKDAVTIVADESGRTRVNETIDPTPARAAVTGALWGSLIGLFAIGPLGWLGGAVLGAAAAAILAQFVDIGVTDGWIAWFRQVAIPGTATLALLVDHLNADALLAEAARFPGARVVATSLDVATDARLRAVLGQNTLGQNTFDQGNFEPHATAEDRATASTTSTGPDPYSGNPYSGNPHSGNPYSGKL